MIVNFKRNRYDVRAMISSIWYYRPSQSLDFMNGMLRSCKIPKCDFVSVSLTRYHTEQVLLLEIAIILLSDYVTVFTVIQRIKHHPKSSVVSLCARNGSYKPVFFILDYFNSRLYGISEKTNASIFSTS